MIRGVFQRESQFEFLSGSIAHDCWGSLWVDDFRLGNGWDWRWFLEGLLLPGLLWESQVLLVLVHVS